MLRTNLWNDSVSRVVLDHRSREAHLQLERLERLLVHVPQWRLPGSDHRPGAGRVRPTAV